MEIPQPFQADIALLAESCPGADESRLCFLQSIASSANLIANWTDLQVPAAPVFPKIWEVQSGVMHHLYQSQSGEHDAWIGHLDPQRPFERCFLDQRSEQVLVVAGLASLALPVLSGDV